MSFLSSGELTTYVASHVAKANGTLAGNWTEIVRRAETAAQNEIYACFVSRGFTKVQIDQWDRGAEFVLDIGAWWALTHNAATFGDGFSQATLDKLDRRKELWGDPKEGIIPAPLLVSGEWVDPEGTRGQVSWGTFREDDVVFGIEDENDPRRGEVTRL